MTSCRAAAPPSSARTLQPRRPSAGGGGGGGGSGAGKRWAVAASARPRPHRCCPSRPPRRHRHRGRSCNAVGRCCCWLLEQHKRSRSHWRPRQERGHRRFRSHWLPHRLGRSRPGSSGSVDGMEGAMTERRRQRHNRRPSQWWLLLLRRRRRLPRRRNPPSCPASWLPRRRGGGPAVVGRQQQRRRRRWQLLPRGPPLRGPRRGARGRPQRRRLRCAP